MITIAASETFNAGSYFEGLLETMSIEEAEKKLARALRFKCGQRKDKAAAHARWMADSFRK